MRRHLTKRGAGEIILERMRKPALKKRAMLGQSLGKLAFRRLEPSGRRLEA